MLETDMKACILKGTYIKGILHPWFSGTKLTQVDRPVIIFFLHIKVVHKTATFRIGKHKEQNLRVAKIKAKN